MANGQHGGQRTPNNPAPVSGPGALSQRTDGGATSQPAMVASGGEYGSRKEQLEIQRAAQMQGGGGGAPAPAPTPLDAPTARPDEPITAGAAAGAGPTPEQVGILGDDEGTIEQLKPLLNSLETIANLPGSNPQMRSFVRKLRAKAAEQQM